MERALMTCSFLYLTTCGKPSNTLSQSTHWVRSTVWSLWGLVMFRTSRGFYWNGSRIYKCRTCSNTRVCLIENKLLKIWRVGKGGPSSCSAVQNGGYNGDCGGRGAEWMQGWLYSLVMLNLMFLQKLSIKPVEGSIFCENLFVGWVNKWWQISSGWWSESSECICGVIGSPPALSIQKSWDLAVPSALIR